MIRGILGFTVVFGLTFYITAPTKSDIQKCVETTNYSVQRCEFELNR